MAKKQNSSDTLILQLKEKINKQQIELDSISKPNWKTNCSITVDGIRHNLHVIDVDKCVDVAAYVLGTFNHKLEAISFLEVKTHPLLQGYKSSDWLHDLKLRVDILRKREKEQELKQLNADLDELLSHDKKVELRLAKIAESLG